MLEFIHALVDELQLFFTADHRLTVPLLGLSHGGAFTLELFLSCVEPPVASDGNAKEGA